MLQRSPCGTHTLGREGPEASQSQIIGAQKEAERSEIEERDDRTAIRVSGMNEPMTGAERPNEHRRAEEAILAAIEKGVPLSLAYCRTAFPTSFSFNGVKTIPNSRARSLEPVEGDAASLGEVIEH